MSLRSRVAALIAFAALGCSRHIRSLAPKGPFLSIQPQDGTTAARTTLDPAAVTLALGALPGQALPRLCKYLDEEPDRALRQALPDLFLKDDTSADPLAQVLPDLPVLTAATNVLGSPWSAPGISVRLVSGCERTASRCLPVFAPPRSHDALARRGRALAWAFGHAALLRTPSATRARLLRSLRKAELRRTGTIAMVFGVDRGRLDETELGRLHAAARRVLAHMASGAPERPCISAIAVAPPTWKLPLALGPDEILVIPRLSALAHLQDFNAELERAGRFERVRDVAPAKPAWQLAFTAP